MSEGIFAYVAVHTFKQHLRMAKLTENNMKLSLKTE